MTRREQIVKLKEVLVEVQREQKVLELRANALKHELTNIVMEGFKNGEKLLDLISNVQ